jgi:hypothetical protein
MEWITFKQAAADFPLSRDALHIYAALAIQVGACILFRTSLGKILPWLVVLLLELINEALDLLFEQEEYIHAWQIDGSIHDIINTMALPTMLLLMVRYAPRLFHPPDAREAEKEPPGTRPSECGRKR